MDRDPWAYHSDDDDDDVADAPPTQLDEPAQNAAADEHPLPPLPAASALASMRVAELKQLLRARNYPVGGRKASLIARLLGEDEPARPVPQPSKRKARARSAILFSSSDEEEDEEKEKERPKDNRVQDDRRPDVEDQDRSREECVLM